MTPAEQPDDSAGFLLWRATLRWQRDIAAALKPFGLTHTQFVLLASTWWLGDHGGTSPSQAHVAAYAEVDVMTTSSVLRALQRRGLVSRSADPGDARVKRLAVTAKGRRLVAAAVSVVEDTDASFFAPAGDKAKVLDMLRPLARIR